MLQASWPTETQEGRITRSQKFPMKKTTIRLKGTISMAFNQKQRTIKLKEIVPFSKVRLEQSKRYRKAVVPSYPEQ